MNNFANHESVKQLNNVTKQALDKIESISDKVFERVEKIAALNIATAQDCSVSFFNDAKSVLESKSTSEFSNLFKNTFENSYKRAASYCKSLNELSK